MAGGLQKLDHAALRTNQAFIISLNVIAFILNYIWLAGLVGLVMLIGTLVGRPGFGWIYQRALKPLGWVKPDVLDDNPEPHRFAQGFGTVVMVFSILALLFGAFTIGWGLVWLVVALAALNLWGGFCMGCAVYYWLGRMNLPGLDKSPPEGTTPGMRPKAGGVE